MVRSYKKGSTQPLQFNFQVLEFDCPCNFITCTETLIDDELVLHLQQIHDKLLYPIHVTSGFRCKAYQQHLRETKKPDGTPKYETVPGISQHELGKAADIRTGKHTGAQLEEVARHVGFMAVGTGKRFIHVDMRTDKERSWWYSY